jgi:hypothetical protein
MGPGPNPAPDPALFSSVAFKTPTKNNFFLGFFAYYFLKVHLHHSSKIKSLKEFTKDFSSFVLNTIFA